MMAFRAAVALAIPLLQLGGCNASFPDNSIAGVASSDNSIIYEQVTNNPALQQSKYLQIKSDVPLTVQRYKNQGSDFSHPIGAGDAVVLVTSTCDTSETKVQPVVQYEQGEGGAISVDIKVGIPENEASQMSFLQSSSYDAIWYESGCGGFSKTETPTRRPTPNLVDPFVQRTACLTEGDCDEMRQKMGIDSFLKGEYPSKGCYSKKGVAYWDGSGSVDDRLTESLPGIQERIWCEKVADQTEEDACMTQDECNKKRIENGIESFTAGIFPSKGCFSKNGSAYWGQDGSVEDMSKPDLPGVQERIWCGESKSTKCELGPSANPTRTCGSGQYCQLEPGVCFNKSGVHSGTCAGVTGDACIEIYQPVCGCDGNTYGNSCKATSKGVNIMFEGECEEDPDKVPAKCELGPSANPTRTCGSGQYCQLEPGVCFNKSGIHSGTCAGVTGDACIEIYQPVCGCDGNTYGNSCKASSKGVNIMFEGECEKEACLTQDDCDEQRQKMGLTLFKPGDYPSKGCFSKKGIAYFSPGSTADMSKADLPAIQERIWCTQKRASDFNSALKQQNSDELSQLQHESATSSACSIRSFMFGSLLRNAFSTNVRDTSTVDHTRALNMCTYNAEILLSGCQGSCSSTAIEVSAPKARVIDSNLENKKRDIFNEYEMFQDNGIQFYGRDYKHSARLTFPTTQANVADDVSSGGYTEVPSLDNGSCCEIVCGRPFVDSNGNSLLASSSSVDECGGPPSWLGEASTAPASSIKNITNLSDLGEKWTNSALGEHASVASFAAFSIALMTNNAPSNFIEDSLKAALDEVRHARISFDIASKLMGKQVTPGPLPQSSLEFNHDMTTLVVSVAKEGCVDETLSALAAAAEVELIDEVLDKGAEESSKYDGISRDLLVWIRNELRTIAIDESNHSALAWRTLNWVCAVDAMACDAAKQQVLDESKLVMAFQRRFDVEFAGKPKLLKRMMVAWTHIYNHQKVSHSNKLKRDGKDVGTSVCVDDREIDEGGPSLLSVLVGKVSCIRG